MKISFSLKTVPFEAFFLHENIAKIELRFQNNPWLRALFLTS